MQAALPASATAGVAMRAHAPCRVRAGLPVSLGAAPGYKHLVLPRHGHDLT